MSEIKDKVTFALSAALYLLFNFSPGEDFLTSLLNTGKQILLTAPYVIGITIIVVAVLQQMTGGQKLPWDRRLRLFFLFGIMTGLVQAIYQYAGQGS